MQLLYHFNQIMVSTGIVSYHIDTLLQVLNRIQNLGITYQM